MTVKLLNIVWSVRLVLTEMARFEIFNTNLAADNFNRWFLKNDISEEDAFNVNASHEIASVQTITDSRIIGDDGSISINDSDNRSHKSR